MWRFLKTQCVRVRVRVLPRWDGEERLMSAAGAGIIQLQRAPASESHQSRDYHALQQGCSLITSLLIISFSVATSPPAMACVHRAHVCVRVSVEMFTSNYGLPHTKQTCTRVVAQTKGVIEIMVWGEAGGSQRGAQPFTDVCWHLLAWPSNYSVTSLRRIWNSAINTRKYRFY